MRLRCALVLLLALVFQFVCGQGSNSIVEPSNGFEVQAGEPVTINWTNPSPRTVTIQLVPASDAGNVITLGDTLTNSGSATLSVPSDVPTTQEYNFKIIDDSNSSNVYLSPAFNISPPTSNSSPPTSSPVSSATSTTASAGTTSSSSSSSHQSLSPGAIAGICIGLGFGLLLAGIALFFLRRRHKHRKWMKQQQHEQQQDGSVAPRGANASPYEMTYQDGPVNLNKDFEPPGANSSNDPRGSGEPSEVAGSRNWPREMEATSRFQQREPAELPASEIGRGSAKGNQ